MTPTQFTQEWQHFLKCINFNHSALDARAIAFMNEMPAIICEALRTAKPTKKTKERKSKKWN